MKHNWEYKRLGECFISIKNGANIRQTKGAAGYPITRIETLSGGIFNPDKVGYADITDLNKYKNYILESGDVLMSHINSKQYVGRSVVFPKYEKKYIHGMNLLRLIPSNIINSHFFYYFSQTFHFKNFISKHRKDAVNQSSISISDLKTIPICTPPLSIQERIVRELDEINGMIEGRKEQLKLLDQLAQSIFYDMFGDPISNPKGFVIKALKIITEIINGGTPSTSDESNWNGNVNWVTPAEMNNNLYYGSTKRKITEKAASKLTLMPKGTVLFSSRAPIGKLGITTEPMCCNQGFKNFVCSKEISNLYLYFTLMLSMEKIIELGRGATFKEISAKSIGEYKIPVPPIGLQNEFAAKIEVIEEQKKDIEASIKELETLLASRMDYWFN